MNKDLIHFSNYDLERSINNICDGLKVSTRKILYSCFKRRLFKDEVKVAQLSGYVSEHSAYHHGEASLQQAIIGMAQNFVGANNVSILSPNGQFGTRVAGEVMRPLPVISLQYLRLWLVLFIVWKIIRY